MDGLSFESHKPAGVRGRIFVVHVYASTKFCVCRFVPAEFLVDTRVSLSVRFPDDLHVVELIRLGVIRFFS